MPIPTRSQSVKATTGPPKSIPIHRSEDPKSAIPSATANSGTSQASKTSRLPGPGRSIPAPLPTHTRSQSSSLALPRPVGTNDSSQAPSRTNVSTAAAHIRSQSVATIVSSGGSHIIRPQPRTQSLIRAPSQPTRPSSKVNSANRIHQQIFAPKIPLQVSKPSLEDSISSNTALPASSRALISTAPSRLADELIQLATVHKNSHATLQSYELSVCQTIKTSSLAIQTEEEAVRASERDRQMSLNAKALKEWMLPENELRRGNLHDLSFCLSEISELSGGAGLYTTYMNQFEEWVHKAQEAHQQWINGTDTHILGPINRLDAEHVQIRLEVCAHLLQGLECEIEDRSALAYTLKQARLLITSMRRAVAESQSVSETVLSAQKDWVDEAISGIVGKSNDHGGKDLRLGLWST